MKYKILRSLIKNKVSEKQYVLRDCNLVIDGRSYFADTYKKSGCQYILGGEYDRYAMYLKNTLNTFIDSNVNCYVIFNGGMSADLESRIDIHQNTIKNSDAVKPGHEDNEYCEPTFVKDVYIEVLQELGIKYFIAEYDSKQAIINISRQFNCPVLTNNYQYSLYGVSCITPKSLVFNKGNKSMVCIMFENQACHAAISMGYMNNHNNMMAIFLTLVDEDSLHFKKLPTVLKCRDNQEKYYSHNLLPSVLRWLRRQTKDSALETIMKNLKDEKERIEFMKSYEEHSALCLNSETLAMEYFESNEVLSLDMNDTMWFAKGVAMRRIAIPYVNLKNTGTFSGSWLLVDKNKEDAMLPAIDIVKYAAALLTDSQQDKITFIGRKLDKSSIWNIDNDLNMHVTNHRLFMCKEETEENPKEDLFRKFLVKALPGFDFKLLQSISEDCWVLIISLVYYCKINRDFTNVARSILLSYVMLGPVSEKVGLIKRSNLLLSQNNNFTEKCTSNNDLTRQDCISAANQLMDLFYVDRIKAIFDRGMLHSLAEFQHCLQHMNFLNKLCGERIRCSVYHKTFNFTFVCNAFRKMRRNDDQMKYFEDRLGGKSSVFVHHKKVESVFRDCLSTVL